MALGENNLIFPVTDHPKIHPNPSVIKWFSPSALRKANFAGELGYNRAYAFAGRGFKLSAVIRHRLGDSDDAGQNSQASGIDQIHQ